MQPFPDHPSFQGYNKPSRIEADIKDLEVFGEVPSDLEGVFFRVAPDAQFPPKLGADIPFNGDGMVSAFRFRNGRVDFKQRYVRTTKFEREREAGEALYGAYRNPLDDDESVKGTYRGTANTNVVVQNKKLWALKEDSPPVLMDPWTLETEGYSDLGGQITSQTFTAHPKFDPATGDMCAFGYAAKGLITKDMAYYEISPENEIKHEVWFELPYYCMMHDFGLTEDYACFHVVPIVGSWERLKERKPHFGFDTTKEVYLGILPRRGDAKDVRWFKAPNCFASHVMNAFNDGEMVYFDVPMGKNNGFPFFPDVHGAPFNREEAAARMTRWAVNMGDKSEEFHSMTRLSDFVGEFPRIDDRYAAMPYRHGFMLAQDMSRPLALPNGKSMSGLTTNLLGHMDHATGKTREYFTGTTSTLQEPAFIPRPGSVDEGDGYLVAVENMLAENRSDLVLFDALRIDEGPIARMPLELRLRGGLHGNWVPSTLLPEPEPA